MDKSFPLTGWGSLAVHGGHQQDPMYAHQVPIYASSTYVFDNADQGMRRFNGEEEGYIYSRWGNPTMTEAEQKISALESFGLKDGKGDPLKLRTILHASGMA
ncbi:MAG: PLP-dependent transferase, partial [Ferruginibacter sp.]|nr:PLP-dependent transferase [Chitinophagaceae bacterium]